MHNGRVAFVIVLLEDREFGKSRDRWRVVDLVSDLDPHGVVGDTVQRDW